MSERVTEKRALAQLARTCEALGMPCAYDTNGERLPYDEIRAMRWDDDVSVRGGSYGAMVLDHQAQYGGVRVHAYGADGSMGHCRAPGVFAAQGLASGMDKRQSLREVYDILQTMEANAWSSRGEWERDHGGDGMEDDERARAARE